MTSIGGLAEIALRVNDLESMVQFYRSVVGLELIRQSESMAFFKIAEGFRGHTQVLALFDRRPDAHASDGYRSPDSQASTLDHLAFSIDKNDFEIEQSRLEAVGITVTLAYHDWVSWRSMYFHDPEGNVVELVCFDPKSNRTCDEQ